MKNQNNIPDFKLMARELIDNLMIDAEVMGLKFIKSNFTKEGFMDGSFQAWQSRKQTINYKLLRVTNALFNSINANNDGKSKVTITADMPYAQIHNEGGIVKIPVTPKMKKYFWAMYKNTGLEKWKAMALSPKEQFIFRMPKRQFMGPSKTFTKDFERHIIREILTTFKKYV